MNKKNLIISLMILALAVAGGFYIFNKERKIEKAADNTETQGEIGDPFANIVFPEGIDEATRVVIQANIDGAKKMYEKIPNAWETWISIGGLRVMLGDYTGALSAYRQSIVLQSNNVLGYRNMAEVYNKNLQNYEKAQEYYKLALENNPIDSEIYVSLALVQQYKLNNSEEAEKTLLNGLNRASDKRDILFRLISLYKIIDQADKQAEAENILNNLKDVNGEPIGTIGIQQ